MPKYKFINNNDNIFHIYVYVNAGSIYETDKNRGISHLLEHMLLKSTQDYTEKELLEELTSIAGNYNGQTDKDCTIYYILTHMDNYKKAVEIMNSVINKPLFKEDELEIEKKVVIEEINKRLDDEGELYNNSYLTVFNNFYKYPIEGSEETINSITIKDLENYYNNHYKNFSILINYDKSYSENVKDNIFKILGEDQTLTINKLQFINNKVSLNNKIQVYYRDNNQYSIHLMFPSYDRSMVKENIILNFVKYCLISSGLYGILTYELRSKRGLIYNLLSINESYKYTGIFRIVISTTNNDCVYILKIVLDLLKNFKFSKDLLKDFKKSFINEQKYAFTNDEFKSILNSENLFYNIDLDENKYLNIIKNIEINDIKKCIRNIFNIRNIGILTYGKYKNITKTKKSIIKMINSNIVQ